MSSNDGFFGQFIEDYYAECDEHLGTARRALLVLETTGPRSTPDPALLRELYRSLHTLKGLAGMVGDASSERLAHAVEGVLRSTERAGAPFTGEFVDALFASMDALERCVAARRTDAPAPDVASVLAQLAASLPEQVAASIGEPAAAADLPPAGGGDSIYHFEFVPSVPLAGRGVGVDSVRERLRSLGTLLDAQPRMAEGGLVFDFRVHVSAGRLPDPAWEVDGIRWSVAASDTVPGASSGELVDAAPDPGASAVSETWAPVAGASVVRVDLARLDAVMRLVGDLVISRSRLDDVVRQLGAAQAGQARDVLEETSAAMERQLRQLRERVMRIRLVPVGEVFERLRFSARDAIRESGKLVTLAFKGQSTEIDKLVVDRMLEPLLHLVRNAVTHGIEAPAEREARGKPADGTLTLRAAASGDRIIIDVEDDGAGIDVERVAERGRALGLLAPGESLEDGRLLELLCAPGFSTRDEADLTSGRGVGMDVVQSAVRALAGELSVSTVPGKGTCFAIELPLTLMIVDALLVDVSGQQMAVPQPALREILQVESSEIVTFENNDVIAYRESVLPVVRLSRLFGLAEAHRSTVYVLVVGTEAAPMGLLVDRLIELREIVVHAVTDPLVTVPGVSGATELGDGRVSLILDAAAVLRLAHEQREHGARVRHDISRQRRRVG